MAQRPSVVGHPNGNATLFRFGIGKAGRSGQHSGQHSRTISTISISGDSTDTAKETVTRSPTASAAASFDTTPF